MEPGSAVLGTRVLEVLIEDCLRDIPIVFQPSWVYAHCRQLILGCSCDSLAGVVILEGQRLGSILIFCPGLVSEIGQIVRDIVFAPVTYLIIG